MRRRATFTTSVSAGLLLAGAAMIQPALATDPISPVPVFTQAIKLASAGGGTEPRITVDNTGHEWLITNLTGGDAAVYGSTDGAIWTRTKTNPANQDLPTIDTELVVTRTGRLIATELDFGGVNFRVSYSDDGGATWTETQGTELADTDRPF